MPDKKTIDVLYVHPSGSGNSDYQIPMGVIGLMNSIECTKLGVMYFEVTDALVANARIIALDCHWYFPLREIGRLARRFKKANPDVIIVVGGHTATVFAELITRQYPVDYVIKGDAEMPFPMLIQRLIPGKDARDVPNVVHKDFSTPQSYRVSEKEYSNGDYITVDWFPTFKRRMETVHAVMPFGYDEALGVYPFIPVYKGCKYNCTFCYTKQELYEKLYGRTLVARSPESIVRDLSACGRDKHITQVYMIADFVNILGNEYTERIFSRKYNVNLYYSFEHFNSPSIATLERMIGCFNRCYFTFIFAEPFNKDDYERRFAYLRGVTDFLKSSHPDVRVLIYYSNTKKLLKYYALLRRRYPDIHFCSCTQWFKPIPVIGREREAHCGAYFDFWKKKAGRLASTAFVARSPREDRSRLHSILGNHLLVIKDYRAAIRHYVRAIRLSPVAHAVHVSLGKAYCNMQRYAAAIRHARAALAMDKTSSAAYVLLGYCYAKLRQYKKAVRALQEAERIKPNDRRINFALFSCYRNMGKISRSGKELDKAVRKFKRIRLP